MCDFSIDIEIDPSPEITKVSKSRLGDILIKINEYFFFINNPCFRLNGNNSELQKPPKTLILG